jgi:hypothetical protein
MENIDKLKILLRTKPYDELTNEEIRWLKDMISEEEYINMSAIYASSKNGKDSIEIEPRPATKNTLNKAFAAKFHRPGIFQLKMPVYQSVAAAIVFFLVGFGSHFSNPTEPKVIHDTVQVIKYINRPESTKKLAEVTVKHSKKRIKQLISVPEAEPVFTTQSEGLIPVPESNPELVRQQEIAMVNTNRALNERNGSSMGGDTVLQRMMVTVY